MPFLVLLAPFGVDRQHPAFDADLNVFPSSGGDWRYPVSSGPDEPAMPSLGKLTQERVS